MNQPGSSQESTPEQAHLGIAGKTARFFIESPLSPLLFIAMLMMGLLGLIMTPRQEDPQISVPMVDIMVEYKGASAAEVANLAMGPLERIMFEIPGVKHVYSASQRGQGMVTVQFEVGEQMGPSLVKVNDKLASNQDIVPPGVSQPLVKPISIDDVPVVTLTLYSRDLDQNGVPDVDDGLLRKLAHDVIQSIKEIPETGKTFVVGGRAEQVRVEVFPERLSGYGISLDQVAETIRTANSEHSAGGVERSGSRLTVVTGSFLRSADDVSQLVVGTYNDIPVYVHDVASVTQGPEDANQLVAYYSGRDTENGKQVVGVPAVTIAIAKKEGTNGVSVANDIIERVDKLKGISIPSNVEVSVTRNYGKTADDKVNSLIFKLFVATGFVFFLVLLAFRAFRPAIVVVLVIPVVLLMTIFGAWLMGYTVDRVSLFALIFSIGILVDDAIVVVENIYRRWLEAGKTDTPTAIDAVREVGNPTILATLTVIGALLPMGYVTGMMGPYMEPIPVLGSVAMAISLFAAFVFTPWLAISKWLRPSMRFLEQAEEREHAESEKLERMYRRLLEPLIESRSKQRLFSLGMWGFFLVTCSFFYFNWVAVKMLPLDNKPEFSVVLDLPEGSALPTTANMAHQMARKIRKLPEVTAVQVYAGTAKPFDFNGMVRHYYLRKESWQAELQVQLLDKHERARSSHEIAVQARELLQPIVEGTGVKFAVVEMPPGPPVLQSVVAEVHGPDNPTRKQVAQDLTRLFEEAESLRDVDNYIRDPYDYWRFKVDNEKASRRGISVDTINRNLSMALGGVMLGDVKQHAGHEPVNILIQVPLAERSQITRLGDLPIHSKNGQTLPLRELGEFQLVQEEDIIYHKDLRPVEYVTADVGGELGAPVYGMFQVQDALKAAEYVTPDGVKLGTDAGSINWFDTPENDHRSAIEWTGEWTVTFETFRDMGKAFGVALVVIYILVVWEFGNFRIPALIMAPIPLTLLGIIPAHMLFFQMGWGGEFTATSMIGWIALAGIIVRNSILLVDFSIHEVQKGTPVTEAVILACKTRTRPIMITALALVCGSSVIFFDPIFQGMAISLASGVMVSTILTLIVIPLGCIKASDSLIEVAAAGMPPGESIPMTEIMGKRKQKKPARQPQKPAHAMPLLLRIWGKVIAVLLFTFYAVRGIGLLLLQLLPKKKKVAVADGPSDEPDPGAGPGSGGIGGPGNSSSGTTGPLGGAGGSAGGPQNAVNQAAAVPADTVNKAATSKTVTKKAASKKKVAAKSARKKTAKKTVSKKTPAAGRKKTTSRKPTARKPVGKKTVSKKTSAENIVEKKADTPVEDKPQQAAQNGHKTPLNGIKPNKLNGFGLAVQKKPVGRRGIKLKSMTDLDNKSGLN
ncbi:MAG: efflux RND transporter permease subunit [Chromatiales bacterium]|jgi:multidrug efflux pump subunit AcrB